jgi:tetratricopeptide (TPR) repeat protein
MDKETSEIAKLTERISKDPKSKLFVPLAEEYKKTGEIEMAIYVLTEGLKNNPGYVTARSVLGKLLLEKGDVAASQKEFEEVVKAIPDNLMAQRKLGELYALQNRPDEAVKHFKIVFSANPRDAELASLVSDLEAGRDVTSRIHLPKPQPSPEKPVSQGTQAVPLAQTQTQAIPARVSAATAAPVHQATAAKGPAVISSQKAPGRMPPSAAASVSGPAQMEAEEPEDIVAVEPLEQTGAAPETPAPIPDFLAELAQEPAIQPVEEHFAETVPTKGGEQVRETAAAVESVFAETAPVGEWDTTEPLPDLAGVPGEADIIGAEIVEDALESVVAVEKAGEASEKSDDFTTDTLAELYIAQGFYEKAIDIYERMLADKPTSRGLKDKLERVRAMAAGSGPAAAPAASTDETANSDVSAADVLADQIDFAPPVEADLLAEPRQSRPGSQPAAREGSQTKPSFTDFEPREYMPPKDEFEPAEQKVGVNQGAARPSKASKRETIVRLETWLKNIKKET